MYTLLINNENQVICSKKETIMERSNCVDKIQIFSQKNYKGIDLSDATVYMRYVLPRSKKIKIVKLNIGDMNYEDTHLQFIVPGNLAITSEDGDIEVSFTFIKLCSDGENKEACVRKTQTGVITITPIAPFEDFVVDELFNEVDQRLIALEAISKNIEAQSQQIYENMATDVRISDENKITLTNIKGNMGSGIHMDVLTDIIGKKIVGEDLDGVTDGVVHLDELSDGSVKIVNLNSK